MEGHFTLIGTSNTHGWSIHKKRMLLIVSTAESFCIRDFLIVNKHLLRKASVPGKKAMENDNGIKRHAISQPHIWAVKQWMEKEMRVVNHLTISEQLGPQLLEQRRYYIRSIAKAIQFLIVNELSFRRNYNEERVKKRDY